MTLTDKTCTDIVIYYCIILVWTFTAVKTWKAYWQQYHLESTNNNTQSFTYILHTNKTISFNYTLELMFKWVSDWVGLFHWCVKSHFLLISNQSCHSCLLLKLDVFNQLKAVLCKTKTISVYSYKNICISLIL